MMVVVVAQAGTVALHHTTGACLPPAVNATPTTSFLDRRRRVKNSTGESLLADAADAARGVRLEAQTEGQRRDVGVGAALEQRAHLSTREERRDEW